ncbi:MAG TPA: hypothetical protein VF364_09270 [Candidatus Limnocylindria bacterium]
MSDDERSDLAAGAAEVDPASLMEIIAATSMGREQQAVFDRLGQPYLLAMINGQAFEAVCRLAEPALHAPLDDDQAAQAIVASGQNRKLHNAIGTLVKAAEGLLPDDLVRDLKKARERRNVLAHDMLWLAQEVIAGRGEQLIAELNADAEEFARLSKALAPLIFFPAVEARGITQEEMARFLDSATAAMALFPEVFDGVDFKRPDADDLLARFQRLADLDPAEVQRRLEGGPPAPTTNEFD